MGVYGRMGGAELSRAQEAASVPKEKDYYRHIINRQIKEVNKQLTFIRRTKHDCPSDIIRIPTRLGKGPLTSHLPQALDQLVTVMEFCKREGHFLGLSIARESLQKILSLEKVSKYKGNDFMTKRAGYLKKIKQCGPEIVVRNPPGLVAERKTGAIVTPELKLVKDQRIALEKIRVKLLDREDSTKSDKLYTVEIYMLELVIKSSEKERDTLISVICSLITLPNIDQVKEEEFNELNREALTALYKNHPDLYSKFNDTGLAKITNKTTRALIKIKQEVEGSLENQSDMVRLFKDLVDLINQSHSIDDTALAIELIIKILNEGDLDKFKEDLVRLNNLEVLYSIIKGAPKAVSLFSSAQMKLEYRKGTSMESVFNNHLHELLRRQGKLSTDFFTTEVLDKVIDCTLIEIIMKFHEGCSRISDGRLKAIRDSSCLVKVLRPIMEEGETKWPSKQPVSDRGEGLLMNIESFGHGAIKGLEFINFLFTEYKKERRDSVSSEEREIMISRQETRLRHIQKLSEVIPDIVGRLEEKDIIELLLIEDDSANPIKKTIKANQLERMQCGSEGGPLVKVMASEHFSPEADQVSARVLYSLTKGYTDAVTGRKEAHHEDYKSALGKVLTNLINKPDLDEAAVKAIADLLTDKDIGEEFIGYLPLFIEEFSPDNIVTLFSYGILNRSEFSMVSNPPLLAYLMTSQDVKDKLMEGLEKLSSAQKKTVLQSKGHGYETHNASSPGLTNAEAILRVDGIYDKMSTDEQTRMCKIIASMEQSDYIRLFEIKRESWGNMQAQIYDRSSRSEIRINGVERAKEKLIEGCSDAFLRRVTQTKSQLEVEKQGGQIN